MSGQDPPIRVYADRHMNTIFCGYGIMLTMFDGRFAEAFIVRLPENIQLIIDR